jgi:Fe-S cluster assembly iron-binding protein IscA
MILSIVNASTDVIEEIKKMLSENDSNEKELRIVGSLGFGDIPEGFKMIPSEVTPKDHVEELGGITFIVANILVKLYKGFTITCEEQSGITDLKITAENRQLAKCLA